MLEDESLNNQDDGFEPKLPEPLSKNQKMAVAGLAVFAVLIIGLWLVQLRNNIYGPFNAGTANTAEQTLASDQAAKDQALKNKDTDGDGLSDYDELNIYHTSPYLADTDGDGILDGVEIKNSTDPNCPQGRTCAGGSMINESNPASASSTSLTPESGLNNLQNQNNTLNSLLNQFGATQPAPAGAGTGTGNSAGNLTSDQLQALKNMDAASLRQLLIQNGMPQATLDKISDADLLKSFQETLSGQ